MKQNLFRRILALVLALSCLAGCVVVAASAADTATGGSESGSTTDTTLADVKELLNALSYASYSASDAFRFAKPGSESIKIDALGYDAEKTDSKVYRVKIDEKTGIATVVDDSYVPAEGESLGLFMGDSGELVFKLNIPSTAKYNIKIEYYPALQLVDAEGNALYNDKSGSIERILKINGAIPFSEARYLVLPKIWKNTYTIKMETVKTNVAADGTKTYEYADVTPYIEKAEKCGIKYTVAADRSYITLELPESGWSNEISSKTQENAFRFFTEDIDGNEIRSNMSRVPEWLEYNCKDVDGFYSENFEFVFTGGENEISLLAKSQSMVIKSITLSPAEERPSYDDVKKSYTEKGFTAGSGKLKFEAEFPFATTSQTIYPVEDSSSAITSPADASKTVLNTIGGEKWQTSGQRIRYRFTVDKDGLYNIVTRYRQNVNDGIFSSRTLYLYSDGLEKGADGYYNGVPYAEAAHLRFEYSTDWQVSPLKYAKEIKQENGESKWENVNLEFYFKAGVTYTMELEVSLGDMGSIVSEVSTSLTNINNYYLNILKLTGADPDRYRDYGFYRIMPDTMQGLIVESRRLEDISNELKNIAGQSSSNAATLDKIVRLLYEMGIDEDNVAKNLDQLKTYIGTLGTWINDNKTQPLQLDYFIVQAPGEDLPAAKANFFQTIGHEFLKFWNSFWRNYNRMGATNAGEEEAAVEVWLAYGRDQTQVIRSLINNDFTPQTGHLVNLKLVAAGSLLPSILAQSGPDVYIGVSEDNIINYAIRGALMNIENCEGFYELTDTYLREHKTVSDYVEDLRAENYIITGEAGKEIKAMSTDGVAMYTIKYNADGSGECTDRTGKTRYSFTTEGWLYETGSTFSGRTYTYKYQLDENGNKIKNDKVQFNEAAMYTLGLPDADNIMHYYGLPETQSFSMMFVRNDILANLGIEIPKSWDDVQAAIQTLESKNMQIGMSNDYKIFLYQKGSKLFADDGMRINLDSNIALDSFDYMCNLFTMYSFPYKYDFSNRFRTGEMPIGIAGYSGTYNQLIVFATEIRGLWSFYPVPGIATYKTDEAGRYVYEDGKKVVESINNVAVATVSAISMINGCENVEAAWSFMKWHVGPECQVNYSNEMVAILGDSAKHATANITALESMPWTTDEYKQLSAQFNNLASIPNYPGSYIIARYTKFAFLAAYDKNANPTTSLLKYINTINKEITRKRDEFGLETLEIGETLASKRIAQAEAKLDGLSDSAKAQYKAEIDALRTAIANLESQKARVSIEHIEALEAASEGLRKTQYSDLYEVADCIDTAAEALRDYRSSY